MLPRRRWRILVDVHDAPSLIGQHRASFLESGILFYLLPKEIASVPLLHNLPLCRPLHLCEFVISRSERDAGSGIVSTFTTTPAHSADCTDQMVLQANALHIIISGVFGDMPRGASR